MRKLFFLLVLITSTSFSQKMNYFNYDTFLVNYVTDTGIVDYDKIFKNKEDLRKIVAEFEKTKPTIYWSNRETIAYWINAYNVYSIKIIIDNYPVKSIRDIADAWNINFIKSNGKLISLDFVDREILKTLNEPRYHFAINCTAYSCPGFKRQAYDVDKINSQLEDCIINFVNDKTKNDITPKKANLSKIFDWYKDEFTVDQTLIQYINKYSTVKIKDDAAIFFQEYDWRLRKVD